VPPQELALVVDISMSMAEKLSLVKAADWGEEHEIFIAISWDSL
jgi:hypothetical protein